MSGKAIARTDVDRETLEQMALEACPADQYYDLMDNLEQATDEELWKIVGARWGGFMYLAQKVDL
jgi:hypothetical protein